MTQFTRGVSFLFISILLYSIMPVLIRTLGAGHVPPASQVFLRYIVAFVSAGVYFFVTKATFELKKRDVFMLFAVALFGYALTNLFYTYGMLYTQVGTVLFIFFCSGVITPVLGHIFLKEKIYTAMKVALVLGFIALLFLFRPGPVATWKLGAVFAFASAIGQSLYVIGRKKLSHYSSTFIVLVNTFVGVVAVGLIAGFMETDFYTGSQGITTLSSSTWLVTILFGIDNFAAWLFMTKGFQLVAAGTGSMIMLAENIVGVLFAFLFFAEVPTITTLIGGVLILAASTLVIHSGEKKLNVSDY